jgi:3-oxoacyl-[acyl-carrier protein] reductase
MGPTTTPLLRDQVVVVTGASGGIGSAIVSTLVEHGAEVVAHRHRGGKASDRSDVVWVEAELTDPSAPSIITTAATDAFGRLDGLVNNAAVQDVAPFESLDDDLWQQTLEVNLTAAHRLTIAAAKAMATTGGSIVHIASIEGSQPAPGHGHYAVSKAGLLMHAKAAALELGPLVRVNAVSPGLIDRPGLADDWPEGVRRWMDNAPLGRLGSGSDVANAVVFLLSPMASFISGANVPIDGGVSARPNW